MQMGSELLCPRRDMPGSIWRPGYWQRRHVLYTSIWLFVILLLALEFSFSAIFKIQPIACMLGFKVVWLWMEIWLLKTLTEKLVALPFECGLQTIQYVMTLGAPNFLNFIYANSVELIVMVLMRVAVQPLKFRTSRVLKFKLTQTKAAKAGLPIPVNTPEVEAIGLMSDMLSLMYRFSVDTLGSIISPLTGGHARAVEPAWPSSLPRLQRAAALASLPRLHPCREDAPAALATRCRSLSARGHPYAIPLLSLHHR